MVLSVTVKVLDHRQKRKAALCYSWVFGDCKQELWVVFFLVPVNLEATASSISVGQECI